MGESISDTLSNVWQWIQQAFPPKAGWFTSEIPDLSGRVMIVTGGNAGIGKETARVLLEYNAKVYLACRSEERARAAIEDLRKETGKEAIFLKLDLADLSTIRTSVEDFLSKETALHVLFNNGGVMWPSIEAVTPQGYDMQFGTNVMGHFLFTNLLVPALVEGAKTAPERKARIVHTSSSAIYVPGVQLDFDTLCDGPKRRTFSTPALYNQSKLGNTLVALEMSQRFADKNIITVSLNPGNIKSDLLRHTTSVFQFFADSMLHPASLGALTQLWAGLAPETVSCNGQFLIPWARVGRASRVASDPDTAKKLWAWLKENTGLSSL